MDENNKGRRATDKLSEDEFKPKNWFESLGCALDGVLYAFKTQRHVRVHYTIAVVMICISLLLDLTYIEFMLFALSVLVLLAAEMFNTAIEDLSNLVERRYNEKIKRVKDVSAGGVLISSFGVVIMGYLIITKYLAEPFTIVVGAVKANYGLVVSVSLLLVLIAVVGLKTALGGRLGFSQSSPSGHSAIAFSIWTAVTLITQNILVSVLIFFMALMVSHSRLLIGSNTALNVFTGAISGIGVTCVIFYFFGAAF